MYTIRKLAALVRHFNTASIVLFATCFVLMSALIIRLLEPERFDTFFNALWWVMTTVTTVGYGDLFPETVPGKMFAMFLFIFGIGFIGIVIGKVVDGFTTLKRRREEGRMQYSGEDHIIMIGWSKKAQTAIQEIVNSDFKCDIVLIDEIEKTPMHHSYVHFVQGNPTDLATLKQANVTKAKAVIIFADERIDDTSLTDGKSLLIASTFKSIAPHVHTTVEIMQEKHIANFRHVQVNDFILSHETISRLAVRSVFSEGITNLYTQLISRQHGDDLYEVTKKPEWHTYGDAFQALLKLGATLIADRANMGINRMLDEALPDEAKLFVICDDATYRRLEGKVEG